MPRTSVVFFMLVVLIDSIGFGIIIPVMPSLLRQLGAGDARHAIAFGGVLTFGYAIMQFFCAPIVGALSDRFGRRPVLLASMLAFALDYALMAIVPYYWMLFIGRLIAGVTGACYPTANAAIADVTPPEERAKNFGLTGMAFGIGFILGPLAGGWIGTLGPRAPFVAAAILAALNFVYGLLVVPETLAADKWRPLSFATANPFGALRDIARLREIRGVLVALFLWQLAFQALPSTWAYFTQAAFGWTSSAVGTSMAFSGVMMAVVLGAVIGPAVKRFGERRAAVIGLSMGTIAYLWYAFASAGWMLYVGMAMWALGSLVTPSCNALMSARLGPKRQGELQGIVGASFSLSAVIAPITMSQLFTHVGPSAPWLVSALLACVAIPVLAATTARSVAPATA